MTESVTDFTVTEGVAGRIQACRNHLGLVEAHWGPHVSGHCAMSLVNSLSAVFGLARNGGRVGTAGELGLFVSSFMYAEMVPFELSVTQISKLIGRDTYPADEIDKIFDDDHFVHPVEWSVHS